MTEIRKLRTTDNKPMGPNYRPVQKNNDRPCILFKMPKQV